MSNEAVPKGEAILVKHAREKYVATYGREPTVAACAPGRVNLIGEHIDYCEGFVLPMAIPFLTVVVGGYNNTDECRLLSVLGTGEELQTSFLSTKKSPLKPEQPGWSNYVKGVVANFPAYNVAILGKSLPKDPSINHDRALK